MIVSSFCFRMMALLIYNRGRRALSQEGGARLATFGFVSGAAGVGARRPYTFRPGRRRPDAPLPT